MQHLWPVLLLWGCRPEVGQIDLELGKSTGCLLVDGALDCQEVDAVDGVGAARQKVDQALWITGAEFHYCAIGVGGRLVCWGRSNQWWIVEPPEDLPVVKSVEAGLQVTCGLLEDSSLRCWGLGWELLDEVPSGPFDVLAVGETLACAQRWGEPVQCWGEAAWMVEDEWGTYSYRWEIPDVDFVKLEASGNGVCGLDGAGFVSCWGKDNFGFLSPPTTGGWVDLTVHWSHSCLIGAEGNVECWGDLYPERHNPEGVWLDWATESRADCGVNEWLEVECIDCWYDGDENCRWGGQNDPESGLLPIPEHW